VSLLAELLVKHLRISYLKAPVASAPQSGHLYPQPHGLRMRVLGPAGELGTNAGRGPRRAQMATLITGVEGHPLRFGPLHGINATE
jgi:hypothetical protein